jgi:hypothetical protein
MVVSFSLFLAVLTGVSGPMEEEVSFLAVRIPTGMLIRTNWHITDWTKHHASFLHAL